MSVFPVSRPRRLRRSSALREQIAEVKLKASDFMYPVFVVHGSDIKSEIKAMPRQYHWSVDRLPELIDEIKQAGILSIMLFGLPKRKDTKALENYDDNGIVQQALRLIKKCYPALIIATDVCLCSYTKDGHCGIIQQGEIDNDQTLKLLGKTAISHAKHGADMVAPSGMMDGMVSAIRGALDKEKFFDIAIMSYAVKYASSFYGPFREACDSSLKGDRKSYQMDYRNKKEALKEAEMDEREGADFLMIKPALSYLDIIQDVKGQSCLPIAAYQVSGEYAMIKAAFEKGYLDEKEVVFESLTAIKRAGADIILSYYAIEASMWLKS